MVSASTVSSLKVIFAQFSDGNVLVSCDSPVKLIICVIKLIENKMKGDVSDGRVVSTAKAVSDYSTAVAN